MTSGSAVLTAVLFTLGNYLIGLYLSRTSVASAYGAAGSLVVVLLWVYYSSQILLYGAEFTQVYANRYDTPIIADDVAEPVCTKEVSKQLPRRYNVKKQQRNEEHVG